MYGQSRFAALRPKYVFLGFLLLMSLFIVSLRQTSAQQLFACLRFDVTVGDAGILLVDVFDVETQTGGSIEFQVGLAAGTTVTRVFLIPNNIGYTVGTDLVTVSGGLVRGELRTNVDGTGGSVVELPLSECGLELGTRTAITDGRLNAADLAGLAAIYRQSNGYAIWQIDSSGNGAPSFDVSVEQMVNGLMSTAESNEHALIHTSADGKITFWVLTTAECQLNYVSEDGHTRSFVFNCFQPFQAEAERILDELEAELAS